MFNVSDFKIPTAFIKRACKLRGCAFIDIPVVFDDASNMASYKEGSLHVGNPEMLGDTLSRISSLYMMNFEDIVGAELFGEGCDSQRESLNMYLLGFFRLMCFCQDSYSIAKSEEPIAKRLGQEHFAWIAMKDIVCPAFNISPVQNIKLIISDSPYVDAALFVDQDSFDKGDIGSRNIEEPFIFINSDIEYSPYSQSHLLFEAIKAHGECPYTVIKDMMSSTVKDKLYGLAKLAFATCKEADDFMMFVMTIAGIEDCSEKLIYELGEAGKSLEKTAQGVGNPAHNITDTWWFLGLIEKMLEPARGPDWSTYKRLNPHFEELWGKIEAERKKRGRRGLTYEALLRVKDGERDPDKKNVILEKELTPNRVW